MLRTLIGSAVILANYTFSQVCWAQSSTPTPTSGQIYGTAWGVASFGMKRTSSSYASPFGAGYGYGNPPLGFVPGRFGVELWRPDEVATAGVFGVAHSYRTFPYPYQPGPPAYGPPIGVYAPGFGPGWTGPTH